MNGRLSECKSGEAVVERLGVLAPWQLIVSFMYRETRIVNDVPLTCSCNNFISRGNLRRHCAVVRDASIYNAAGLLLCLI